MAQGNRQRDPVPAPRRVTALGFIQPLSLAPAFAYLENLPSRAFSWGAKTVVGPGKTKWSNTFFLVEHQKTFPQYDELVKEMLDVNKQMIDYAAQLEKIVKGK